MIGLAACQTLPKSGPVYTIRVRHIDDQESYEDHKVRLGENFFLADTEYQAEISRFVPDFAINLKTKKVISRSDKPLNPALLLEVSRHGEPIYETWVLYQNPLPHGIHDPGYYFQFTAYENLD
jgi:hypothetical protein